MPQLRLRAAKSINKYILKNIIKNERVILVELVVAFDICSYTFLKAFSSHGYGKHLLLAFPCLAIYSVLFFPYILFLFPIHKDCNHVRLVLIFFSAQVGLHPRI